MSFYIRMRIFEQQKLNNILTLFINMQKLFYSRSSKGEPLTYKTPRCDLKSSIDSLLKQDIQILQKHQSYESVPIRKLNLSKNNQLIRQYVESNYQEYQINDPLPHMSKKHQRYKTQVELHSQTPHSGYESVHTRTEGAKKVIKLDRTKSKIKTQPSQHKQYSTKYKTATEEDEKSFEKPAKKIIGLKKSPKKSVQTGYSGKSPDQYLTNDFSIEEEEPNFQNIQVISSRIIPQPSMQKKKQKNIVRFEQPRNSPISQTFRYCVGCEKAVLEANISYHESICMQFQNIIRRPLQDILPIIDSKIISFEDKIECLSKNYLIDSSVKQYCLKLVNMSRKYRLQRKDLEIFDQTRKNVEENIQDCTRLLQCISKLNWFLKIKNNVQKNLK